MIEHICADDQLEFIMPLEKKSKSNKNARERERERDQEIDRTQCHFIFPGDDEGPNERDLARTLFDED